MMLTGLILIPLVGGLLAWLADRRGPRAARWVALSALALDLLLALALWVRHGSQLAGGAAEMPAGARIWLEQEQAAWIPQLGIGYHLGLDGLSLLMVTLTALIGVIAVVVSWREIEERVGLFHCALLAVLGGIQGVFLALDLVLFYVFWEVMLVPMYFLIGLWGHERRLYAAMKFFLFTLAGGLLMLVAILGLAITHSRATGVLTFDYTQLLGTVLAPATGLWLMLGFLAAFAVKLPAVPVHCWLPDAHTEAPTAGSLILAALLLKTGAYGLIRFILPLFPQAARLCAPWLMLVGVVGIIYGAVVALRQHDLKRLVAYTSVSHMGFVLLGIFAGNAFGLQGAVLQMICHAFSTGALFVIVGMLRERLGTRDLTRMGGLWAAVPRLGGLAMVFVMASLGLPGLGNFAAEFLVVLGTYRVSMPLAVGAGLGVVLATIYSLAIMQRVFHGPRDEGAPALRDLSPRETIVLAVLALALIALGFFPQPVLEAVRPLALSLAGGQL